jgi:hypothetical protein
LGAHIFSSLVGVANIGQLITDAVRDDVRVQRLFLALGNQRIDGLEGELIRFTVGNASLELDGGDTFAEISTSDSGLLNTSISITCSGGSVRSRSSRGGSSISRSGTGSGSTSATGSVTCRSSGVGSGVRGGGGRGGSSTSGSS